MPSSLVTTWFGSFLVSDGQVKARRLAPQTPETIAERLRRVRAGDVLDEERELAKEAGSGLVVFEKRLSSMGSLDRTSLVPAPPFDPNASGYPARLLHEALLHLAAKETHLHLADRDLLVVQQIRALDEIVKAANGLAERLREWYAVHAPEVVGRVREHSDLAHLVAEATNRDEVAKRIEVALSGIGVEAPAADEAIVRTFAHGLATLYDTWKEIEGRIADVMKEVAPNLTVVAGPMLGARLIATAGGLERLAMLPSGTIQTLGAENALFRHLREGSPPPKHGLLFQYEAVNRAPWWQRGKIARALSGKISIAAKADAFGDNPERGTLLLAEFQARLTEIQRQNARPPQRGPRRDFGGPPRHQGGGRPYRGGGPPQGGRRGPGGPRRDRR